MITVKAGSLFQAKVGISKRISYEKGITTYDLRSKQEFLSNIGKRNHILKYFFLTGIDLPLIFFVFWHHQ